VKAGRAHYVTGQPWALHEPVGAVASAPAALPVAATLLLRLSIDIDEMRSEIAIIVRFALSGQVLPTGDTATATRRPASAFGYVAARARQSRYTNKRQPSGPKRDNNVTYGQLVLPFHP
jgi:hypothetical protein